MKNKAPEKSDPCNCSFHRYHIVHVARSRVRDHSQMTWDHFKNVGIKPSEVESYPSKIYTHGMTASQLWRAAGYEVVNCPDCNGTGVTAEIYDEGLNCRTCSGTGVARGDKVVDLHHPCTDVPPIKCGPGRGIWEDEGKVRTFITKKGVEELRDRMGAMITVHQSVWGVVDPKPGFELTEIVFETTLAGIERMVKGGLELERENLALYTVRRWALADGLGRLRDQGKAAENLEGQFDLELRREIAKNIESYVRRKGVAGL